MNRVIVLSLCCIGLSLCLFFPQLQASSMDMPQEVVMEDAKGKVKNPLYTPVTMPHQVHVPQGCEVCHHKWEDKSQAPQKCTASGCHDLIGATGSEMQEVEAAYNAYHNRESQHSCMGCHIQKNEADEAHGPFEDCAGCHPKD